MFATIWPTTRPTLRRLKKPRKEPPLRSKHCKRKRGKLVLKVPLLRFHLLAPPELAVRLALFLQLLVIFVPKVDTLTTHSEASTCAFDAVNEDTGPICAPPKTNRCLQDQNLNFLDQYEFEQDIEASSFTQGKLHANFTFWRDTIQASDFVLDIIQNGYKILFMESPLPFSIENRSSALRRDSFVREAISELMARGCVREVQEYPQFCNPLHVAVQSSGKLRLILDLSHLNKFVVKKSVKYEDLRTVLQMFSPGMFVFSFDLKSAYHHIDICEEHMKFLSFKWPSVDGVMHFYEFKVLPFGLTSAPYIFTKIIRQLVKFWRAHGYLALMYLDDGIGGNLSFESAENISVQVRKDLTLAGFTANDEKSNWEPVQKLVFLGSVLDFQHGLIHIPEERILKLKSSIASCLQKSSFSARGLASITGQIISMSCAVGNITRLLTRNCFAALEQRTSWDQPLDVSLEIRNELLFWQNNIDSINGKPMSPKSSAVGVVYSDASDTGFGGYFVQCGQDLVSGTWSEKEMHTSSTLREILAVKFVLLSLLDKLSGLTVKWFTDNQNVPRIISSGSSKGHLQTEALSIFNICCHRGISIEMEWIPRSQNDQADFLSRIYDPDDWGLSWDTFQNIDIVWGPHSFDRFANYLNAKLPRFNSRFWNPGSEGIDSFVMNWAGENNYVCPPICLIPRVLLHMRNCKASGTLIVPLWHSAPFWPMISAGGDKFSDFIVDWMDLPSLKEAFIPGRCNSVFGNENLNFRMLALRIHFV